MPSADIYTADTSQRISGKLWRAESHEMSSLAFKTFYQYGYLSDSLKDHPVRRGTGAWRNELDFGPLFFVERMEVTDKEWQRLGLGRAMVNSLVQKVRKVNIYPPGSFHILVTPGWLVSDLRSEKVGKSFREQQESNLRALDSAIAFYRSLGFRRVGASNCFALSLDPKHRSHAIATADDFDPPIEAPEDDSDTDEPQNKLLKLKKKLPLHHATLTMPDAECVEFYKTFTSKDGSERAQVDCRQETLLHVAACHLKPESVKWLMEKTGLGQDLALARNISGYTPLEALEAQLEIKRTQDVCLGMSINVSHDFHGFSPEALSCISMLLGVDLQNLTNAQLLRAATLVGIA